MTDQVVARLEVCRDSERNRFASVEISLFPNTTRHVSVLLELVERGRGRDIIAATLALGHIEEHGSCVVRPNRKGWGVTAGPVVLKRRTGCYLDTRGRLLGDSAAQSFRATRISDGAVVGNEEEWTRSFA